MTAQETLETFFEKLKVKEVKFTDVLPLLTKTQQEYSEYIGKPAIHNHLIGLYTLTNQCKTITVREKPSSNKVMTDFKVTFAAESKAKFTCRMIKEVSFQKTGEEGSWGVVVNSFKLIKEK